MTPHALQIVGGVPRMIEHLEAQQTDSSVNCLNNLSGLLHCLMALHPGFPDLYEPIIDCLKVGEREGKKEVKQGGEGLQEKEKKWRVW